MPVSGLVLTMSLNATERDDALGALRRHASIDVGEAQGHRLPIVVDTMSSDDDKDVWEWLHTLPGVVFVDMVCADNSADEAATRRKT